MRTCGAILATLVIAVVALGAERQPDVHLHVVDSLRADHLPTWGYPRDTAPRLTRLASRSAVWMQAVSTAPWTPPSTATILTGLHPWEHGIRTVTPTRATTVETMRPEIVTLAERMQRAGYRTVGVVANPWLIQERGYGRGFDVWHMHRQATPGATLLADVLQALAIDDPRPVFLYVHWLDVHCPWSRREHDRPYRDIGAIPPEYRRAVREPWAINVATGWNGESNLARICDGYDQGIRAWDDVFGQYLDAVESAGRHPVVIVTSDHGDELYTHGRFGHGHSLYRELLHVPLILYDRSRRPTAYRQTVSLVDLAPTVLDVAGVERDERSLLRDAGRRLVYATIEADGSGGPLDDRRASYAVRNGDRKLIYNPRGLFEFDLAVDPREQQPRQLRDLAGDPLALRLSAYMERSALVSPRVELPADLRERLQALGYE